MVDRIYVNNDGWDKQAGCTTQFLLQVGHRPSKRKEEAEAVPSTARLAAWWIDRAPVVAFEPQPSSTASPGDGEQQRPLGTAAACGLRKGTVTAATAGPAIWDCAILIASALDYSTTLTSSVSRLLPGAGQEQAIAAARPVTLLQHTRAVRTQPRLGLAVCGSR
ncbi:MAG: hypothetical protein LQ349_000633 [Xanthoria aureola]|nr:MAG: hypothetical protein LQ349_000633 [Xanthoria aureola]